MKVGDEVKVRLIEHVNENTAKVIIIDTKMEALLKFKGRLKIQKDGSLSVWVLKHNPKDNFTLLGNSYFGKFDISIGITNKYSEIISSLFENPLTVSDMDISTIKGMVNRCLKHDQWDWYTTYRGLGYPDYELMKKFVYESIIVRNSIREGNYQPVMLFRNRYSFMLRSMLLFLKIDKTLADNEEFTAIKGFNQELWDRLSNDSKKNIIVAEKISGSMSQYILMHYFVTIEKEFFSHFIDPFIESEGKYIKINCNNKYLETTHKILTGKVHFSIGAIFHLGKNFDNEFNFGESYAIRRFNIFLEDKKESFKELCNLISNKRISGISLTQLRNGLAHGDSEIIAKINSDSYHQINEFLFKDPDFLLKKILENSKKY